MLARYFKVVVLNRTHLWISTLIVTDTVWVGEMAHSVKSLTLTVKVFIYYWGVLKFWWWRYVAGVYTKFTRDTKLKLPVLAVCHQVD